MERIVEQAFLYDFYGELLTEHQRQVYEDFVLNNLSLSEIAQDMGVSRQGIHDMIRRCDKVLEGYESKLHLVEKFMDTGRKVKKIQKLLDDMKEQESSDFEKEIQEIQNIVNEILDSL